MKRAGRAARVARMRAFLIFICVLLSIPALLIGTVGGAPDRPFLIAGAILLGSATIAVALPEGRGAAGD